MGKKLMKNLVLLCAVIVLCFAVSTMASAETWGDYEYSILENGTVEITCYTGTEAYIEIPEEISGSKVTSIADSAFYGNIFLKSVYIPDSVTNIGSGPFCACCSLENISVAENNSAYITEDGVLLNLDKTELIQYPAGNVRTEYDIPDSVKKIGVAAFDSAVNLEYLDLHEGITYIDDYAFQYCASLKELILPDSLLFLGDGAIAWCLGLTELTIPEKIIRENSIGPSVYSCYFIEKIFIESSDCNSNDIMWYMNLPVSLHKLSGISQERAIELLKIMVLEIALGGEDLGGMSEFERYIEWLDTDNFYDSAISTVYCHGGSTCEALAIEYGFEYELTHFFKGEWTYDYDNMIRTRKCIHCDELEIEELQVATDNKVEVIVPGTGTKVEVEIVDKSNDNYILVGNKLSEAIDSNFKILKVFDINLKNNDGVHVKNDGTVKVKLPLDWEKDGDYKVYRLNDDGTLTDMNAYRQGSHMIFDTDHFSIYVIVEENVQEEAPEVTPDEEKKDDLYAKILDWFRSLLDLILRLFNI